jgi:hypothetical protein
MTTLRRFRMVLCWLLVLELTRAPARAAERSEEGAQPRAGVAGALPDFEAALHGFPAMFDSAGKKIADGEFTQWLEGEHLHVKITYDFGNGHRIEEKTAFREQPILVQEEWSWEEVSNGQVARRFRIDFASGKAEAEKREEKGLTRWAEKVKVEPGHTFAGFGFTLAIKTARSRLVGGENVEFAAIGFLPKPRVVAVEISYGGLGEMEMGQRKVRGEHFMIHPEVPAIARAFVEVHDTGIWLTSRPYGFLRWEGPLLEPSDPIVRVDLLPGERSGPAAPAAPRGRGQ